MPQICKRFKYWICQGDDLVPFPGTKRKEYLSENSKSLDISLSKEDMDRIDFIAGQMVGDHELSTETLESL